MIKYYDHAHASHSYIEHDVYAEYGQGAPGLARKVKKKPTPIQIEKQNHWIKVRNCRRTIQLNFKNGDLWITLAYRKGSRKDMEAFKKDIEAFQGMLRRQYRQKGCGLKWIRRLEIGKRGGLHAHYIINNIDGATEAVTKCWKKAVKDSGRVYFTTIDEEDGFNGLAEYICKEPTEEIQGQIRFLIPDSEKKLVSISSSRNLKRPQAVKKRINPWSLRQILTGQQVITPTEGFFIEKDTVKAGINKYTGLPYLRYRERRIEPNRTETEQKTKIEVYERKRVQIEHKSNRKRTNIFDKAKGLIKRLWTK